MKLIVRSQYWGRTLKGKTCRSPASMNRPYRTISSQAVLYNTDEYWGCCPHHGKRVLELRECHFQDAMPDQNWDLYSTSNWLSPNYCINEFFLLPQSQSIINVSQNIILCGWTFVGSCTANRIRSDLDGMLRPWLNENDHHYKCRYHHVHIDIMMDKAFDRETPRSRRVNNERARQERQQHVGSNQYEQSQETSDATVDTGSSERDGPPSASGNPFVLRNDVGSSTRDGRGGRGGGGGNGIPTPPIPHVISNDSSSVLSHSVASSAVAYHDGYGLSEATSFWSPGGSIAHAHNPHPGMQWHPGSARPMVPQCLPHHLASPIHHQDVWTPHHAGMPPPPQIHGQMPSLPMAHHHHPMSDLQQYFMYADPLAAASTHSHHQEQIHHYSAGHHSHLFINSLDAAGMALPNALADHFPPHHSSTAAVRHPEQNQSFAPYTYGTDVVPRGAHVPSEILSSPTSKTITTVSPTMSPPPTLPTIQSQTLSATTSRDNINGNVTVSTTPTLETGITTSSLSTTATTESDAVVTTVTSNHMISSTCWSKKAAAATDNPTNDNSPTSTTSRNSPDIPDVSKNRNARGLFRQAD